MLQALKKEYERQTFLKNNMGDYYPTYSYDNNGFIVDGGDTMNFVCRNKYGEWMSILRPLEIFAALFVAIDAVSKDSEFQKSADLSG